MEYAEHGSLRKYLNTREEELDKEQVERFVLDIAYGMKLLYGTHNIQHRDFVRIIDCSDQVRYVQDVCVHEPNFQKVSTQDILLRQDAFKHNVTHERLL